MTLISSSLAGLLWKLEGPRLAFSCGAVFGGLAFILLAILVPNRINLSPERIN
jgi:hypothetical protein